METADLTFEYIPWESKHLLEINAIFSSFKLEIHNSSVEFQGCIIVLSSNGDSGSIIVIKRSKIFLLLLGLFLPFFQIVKNQFIFSIRQ
jgi:hypothetical protein